MTSHDNTGTPGNGANGALPPRPDPEAMAAELAALPVLEAAGRMAEAAKACGIRVADLRSRVAELRREAMRAAQGSDAGAHEPETEAERAPPLTAAEVEAELERLAGLSRAERDAGLRGLRDRARRDGCAPGYICPSMEELKAAVTELREKARAEAEALHRNTPLDATETRFPLDFAMAATGLMYGSDQGDTWLSSPFEVLGVARNRDSEGQGLHLAWHDADGARHTAAVSYGELHGRPGETEGRLHGLGLRITTDAAGRTLFRRCLAELRTSRRVRTVHRGGWHGPVYVAPNGVVIGESDAEVYALAQRDPEQARRYGSAGSLEEWRGAVAAPAVGNATAVVCLSAAFAGPLLRIVDVRAAGIHWFGGSKNGKTLASRMGLSVWGKPAEGAALLTWNSTAASFAALAESANDALLYLDESGEARPETLAQVVYELANGSERARLTREAQARARREWRTFTLSTGETNLASVCARAGQRLPEGAAVRLPSVPLPANAWPALHGHAAKDGLWRALNDGMARQHGTAAPAFLTRLAAERADDPEGLRRLLRADMDAFLAKRVPAGADAQVAEVARVFALLAVAGELATAWDVLPWPAGEATEAASAAFDRWLETRGGSGAGEAIAYPDHLRRFLTTHGTSRFQAVVWRDGQGAGWELQHDPARPVLNRVGWRYVKSGEDFEYCIPSETWAAEVFAGQDAAAAARVLAEADILGTEPPRHRMLKRKPPGEAAKRRMYVVKAAELFADADAEPDQDGPEGAPNPDAMFRDAPTATAPEPKPEPAAEEAEWETSI